MSQRAVTVTAPVCDRPLPKSTLRGVPVQYTIALANEPRAVTGGQKLYYSTWHPDDGNSMFAAFAKGLLLQGQQAHLVTRRAAVTTMRANPGVYRPWFLVNSMSQYLAVMSRPGTRGDNITLKALCEHYSVSVYLLDFDQGRMKWSHYGDSQQARIIFYLYAGPGYCYQNLLLDSQIRFR